MVKALEADRRCPRKVLIGLDLPLLPPAANDALHNVNTPEDWRDYLEGAAQ